MTSWTPESRSRQKTSDRARKWLKWALIALLSHSLGWASCHHLSYLSYLSSSQHPAASGATSYHDNVVGLFWPCEVGWAWNVFDLLLVGVQLLEELLMALSSGGDGAGTVQGTVGALIPGWTWLNLAEEIWSRLFCFSMFFSSLFLKLWKHVKACESTEQGKSGVIRSFCAVGLAHRWFSTVPAHSQNLAIYFPYQLSMSKTQQMAKGNQFKIFKQQAHCFGNLSKHGMF